MAKHSHWAKVKRAKGVTDVRRGKLFSKLSKAIMTAVRNGGADPDMNLRLQYAIEKAREASVPRENIERAILKGAGKMEGETLDEVLYEAYAPGGVAFLIEALTDNRDRTAPQLRTLLEKQGGNLAAAGAVAWNFEKKGRILVEKTAAPEDAVMEAALESGAEDVLTDEEGYQVLCAPKDFDAVLKAFKQKKIVTAASELAQIPKSTVSVDAAIGEKVQALLDALDEHDDVQNVYSNWLE